MELVFPLPPEKTHQIFVQRTGAALLSPARSYDSAMSDTYASHFVIGNWLKGHKCGEGLNEDCPNELKQPGSLSPEVDVMAFLGVNRAKPIAAKESSDSIKES